VKYTGTAFENNRTQAARLPVDVRFADNVKKIRVRKPGKERILTLVDHTWNSFFLVEQGVSEDFLSECASQEQQEREVF